MATDSFKELPFFILSNSELIVELQVNKYAILEENSILLNYVKSTSTSGILHQLNFRYVTETQFNACFSTEKNNVELAVFHVNIRSLNCHCRQLCQFLQLLCINFDVIVLSEIWSYNIEFYSHVLPDYNFYYDLPDSTKIGGVGVFIRKNLGQHLLPQYKIVSSNANKVENMWFEITKNKKKYIMGGIYRHPNQSIKVFQHCMDEFWQ